MSSDTPLTAGTGTSVAVERGQVCGAGDLEPVLFIGYIPPVIRHQSSEATPSCVDW